MNTHDGDDDNCGYICGGGEERGNEEERGDPIELVYAHRPTPATPVPRPD